MSNETDKLMTPITEGSAASMTSRILGTTNNRKLSLADKIQILNAIQTNLPCPMSGCEISELNETDQTWYLVLLKQLLLVN